MDIPEALKKWHCGTILDVVMDLEIGGEFMIHFEQEDHCDHQCVRGKYLTVDKPNRLQYSWKWDGEETEDTIVTVEFEEQSNRQTMVKVTHERFETQKSSDNHQMGWENCLDGLRSLVEEKESISS